MKIDPAPEGLADDLSDVRDVLERIAHTYDGCTERGVVVIPMDVAEEDEDAISLAVRLLDRHACPPPERPLDGAERMALWLGDLRDRVRARLRARRDDSSSHHTDLSRSTR